MVSEIGFSDMLSLAQTIGIVGTTVLTLYFSKRQIQSLLIDQQTSVLNDLNEKYHSMAKTNNHFGNTVIHGTQIP